MGADCDPKAATAPDCDRHHGLVCDNATKKCVAMTFATAGQACGSVNGNFVPCAGAGFCAIATGQKAGMCVGAAADGAACDTSAGPMCMYRSQCVIASGTAGTCQFASASLCK
jgi:hypothetical protein